MRGKFSQFASGVCAAGSALRGADASTLCQSKSGIGHRAITYFQVLAQMYTSAIMRKHSVVLSTFVAGLTLIPSLAFAAQGHSEHHAGTKGLTMQTPQSLADEHRELHETLARAAKEGGELGRAADELERALAPHFRREEEIATPPLGLLRDLARGKATKEMRAVLPMTQALERELPKMLEEHEVIRRTVAAFRAAAERASREEYVRFSDELAAHARQEEEILYPAAVLVGRYIATTAPAR